MAIEIRDDGSTLIRRDALCIAVFAMLCLPIAELRSGYLLGNLHPTLGLTRIFIARWGLDGACVASILVAAFAWKLARRRTIACHILLFIAVALPIAGDAYLEHVDAIVSYPPEYFSDS